VLDASRVLAGPFCGQILGDLGAEVIKIEKPGSGDETRSWGPPFTGSFSAYYLSCNRNKRSVALDLSRKEGVGLFYTLLKQSDALLENFRPASAARLGISPNELFQVNPRLIICSISGFGRTGPLRDLPGYDFAIQALSGFMSNTGPVEGPPCKVGVAVTDVLTGLYASVALLACLRARERSGHGYHIDVALLDCAVAAQVNLVQAYLTSGQVPPRQGNAHLQIVPYQLFATADDWIVLAVGNDDQWLKFCQAAQRLDLADDARFRTNSLRVANRRELIPLLESVLRERKTAAWQEALVPVGVPHAPVWNYDTLFAHPQTQERGLRISVSDPEGNPVDLVASPLNIRGFQSLKPTFPPALGEHTESILKELAGLDSTHLDALRANGIIE
jgi:crotonobetainyl-CoA:carnitine CoA-transferase CaiB-like acyl-CoA transferase